MVDLEVLGMGLKDTPKYRFQVTSVLTLHPDVAPALHAIREVGKGSDVTPTPLVDIYQRIAELVVGFLQCIMQGCFRFLRFLGRSGLHGCCLAMGCPLSLVFELHIALVTGKKALTHLPMGLELVLSTQGLATFGAVQLRVAPSLTLKDLSETLS